MGKIGEPLLSSPTATSKNSVSAGILRELKTNLLFFPSATLSFKTKCLLDLLWILPPAVGDHPGVEQREGCSGHPLEPSRTKPWLSSRVPPTQTIPSFCDFIALTASAGLSVFYSLFSSPKAFSKLLSNSWVPFNSLRYMPKPYQLTTLYGCAQRSMPGMQWMNFQGKEPYPPALEPDLLMLSPQGLPACSVQGPWSLQASGRRTAWVRCSSGPVQSPPFPCKPFLCPAGICQRWSQPGGRATV